METATYISLSFNFILLLILVYFDWSRRSDAKNKDEVIKDLSLKIISRTTAEYVQAKGKPPVETKETPDPYLDLDDVPTDKLLDAEDKI